MPSRLTAGSPRNRPTGRRGVTLFVATRKGLFLYDADAARRTFKPRAPLFFGCDVHHAVVDPRDGRTALAGVKTGHLGPTVFRSIDRGRTWKEASGPPRFRKAEGDAKGRAVKAVFWLTPGHASRPSEWWAGTIPHGVFKSTDGGVSFEECVGFSTALATWSQVPGRIDEAPPGPITHSILVDPRDPRRLVVGLSTGGTFQSRDEGATWTPHNAGVVADFLPEKDPEWGHDPHLIAQHPLLPQRLWQQNHCGIYRVDEPERRWTRIGLAMPKSVGDVGFSIVLHPTHVDTAWVLPMDGTSVWPRTSVGGKPAVYRTTNAGRSWTRSGAGFPRSRAYWTVMRQAFTGDGLAPAGLYLGTTSGSVWASRDEGARFREIARDLPYVQAVTAAAGF